VTCPHGMPTATSCFECMEGTGIGPPPKEDVTVVATFVAAYDGQCGGCNLPITVGRLIHKLSNDSYVHPGCQR
jgi:hypothetical protein